MPVDLLENNAPLNTGKAAPVDPLSGMGDAGVTSFRQGKPESPLTETWNNFVSFWGPNAEKEKAKASNALVYSELLGISPSHAYKYHDEISSQIKDKLSTEKIATEAKGIAGAFTSGVDTSIFGMMANQAVPKPFESVSQLERWVHGFTSMGLDLPIFLAGAKIAGLSTANPIIGFAGGFGLTSGLRQVLIDKYTKGEMQNFGDFMERTSNAVRETIKGQVVGAATGAAGAYAPRLWQTLGGKGTPVIGWKAMNELAAMTTAGKLIEGHLPTFQDFVDNAGMFVAMHYGMKGYSAGRAKLAPIVNRMKQAFVDEGINPRTIVEKLSESTTQEVPEDINKAIDDLIQRAKNELPAQPPKEEVVKEAESTQNAKAEEAISTPKEETTNVSREGENVQPESTSKAVGQEIENSELWFHSTDRELTSLMAGQPGKANAGGIFLTSDPKGAWYGENLYGVKASLKNPLVIDKNGLITESDYQTLISGVQAYLSSKEGTPVSRDVATRYTDRMFGHPQNPLNIGHPNNIKGEIEKILRSSGFDSIIDNGAAEGRVAILLDDNQAQIVWRGKRPELFSREDADKLKSDITKTLSPEIAAITESETGPLKSVPESGTSPLDTVAQGTSAIPDVGGQSIAKEDTSLPKPQEGATSTAISQAEVDTARAARGLEPIEKVPASGNKANMEAGKRAVDSGTIDTKVIVDQAHAKIEGGEGVALTAKEEAALQYEIQKLENLGADLRRQVKEGEANGQDVSTLKDSIAELEFERNRIENTLSWAGTEWSNIGRARQAIMDTDYSYAGIITRLKRDGIEITEARRDTVQKISDEYQRIMAEKEAIAYQRGLDDAQKSIDSLAKEERRRQRKEKRQEKIEDLDAEFDNIAKTFNKELSSLHAGVDPTLIKYVVQMARNRVQKGVIKAVDIVDDIYAKFQEVGIGYTKREIQEALSGYGVTKEMSKNEINVTLREIKAQLRLTLALEDVLKGQKPLKSGLQYEPESETVKDMRRAVKLAMRESGIDAYESKSEAEQLGIFRKSLEAQIKMYERRLAEEDFGPRKKKDIPQLTENELSLEKKLEDIKKRFAEARYDWSREQMTTGQRTKENIIQAFDLIKAIKSSWDFSFPGRQGFMYVLSHPIKGGQDIMTMLRSRKSEEVALAIREQIKMDPLYNEMLKAGIEFTDIGNKSLGKFEEGFRSRWANKVPGVEASERMYVTMANIARSNLFKEMYKNNFSGREPSKLELEWLGKYVNEATGRGTIKGMEQSLNSAGNILWAPKLYLSRFQLALGHSMWGGTAATRIAIAKEYARALTSLGIIYTMASLAGAQLEFDPRSSDFGKIIMGKTRIDPLAGISQATVLMARMMSREKKTLSGKIVPLAGDYVPYKGDTIWSTAGRFLQSKLTPVLGMAGAYWEGKDFVGKPKGWETVLQDIAPLSFGDIYQAMTEEGVPAGTALSMLSLFGIGLQVHTK